MPAGARRTSAKRVFSSAEENIRMPRCARTLTLRVGRALELPPVSRSAARSRSACLQSASI